MREHGSMTRKATETALADAGFELPQHTVIGSREAIYEAIRQGLGASVVPLGEVPDDPALRVVPFSCQPPVLHEYLYCLENRKGTRLLGPSSIACVTAGARRGTGRDPQAGAGIGADLRHNGPHRSIPAGACPGCLPGGRPEHARCSGCGPLRSAHAGAPPACPAGIPGMRTFPLIPGRCTVKSTSHHTVGPCARDLIMQAFSAEHRKKAQAFRDRHFGRGFHHSQSLGCRHGRLLAHAGFERWPPPARDLPSRSACRTARCRANGCWPTEEIAAATGLPVSAD